MSQHLENGGADDLWVSIGKISSRQTGVETGLASLAQSHTDLQRTVHEGFKEIRSLLEDKTRPRPTNWIGIAALVVSMAGVMGALGLFAIDPIREWTQVNREELKDIRYWQVEHIDISSRHDAQVNLNTKTLEGLRPEVGSLRERVAALETKH